MEFVDQTEVDLQTRFSTTIENTKIGFDTAENDLPNVSQKSSAPPCGSIYPRSTAVQVNPHGFPQKMISNLLPLPADPGKPSVPKGLSDPSSLKWIDALMARFSLTPS